MALEFEPLKFSSIQLIYGISAGIYHTIEDGLRGVPAASIGIAIGGFAFPTFCRLIGQRYEELRAREKDPSYPLSYFSRLGDPGMGLTAIVAGMEVAVVAALFEKYYYNPNITVTDLIIQNPSVILFPLCTQLISAGYERYRADAQKAAKNQTEHLTPPPHSEGFKGSAGEPHQGPDPGKPSDQGKPFLKLIRNDRIMK